MLNLIRYELKKIQGQVKIMLLIFLLAAGSGAALFYEIVYDTSAGVTALAERELFVEMEGLTPDEQREYLEQKMVQQREALLQLAADETLETKEKETIFKKMQQEFYFYEDEIEALEECCQYTGILENLSENTGGLQASALGKSNAYLKKQNEKICSMYAALERKSLRLAASAPVNMLVDFSWNDLFLMLAVSAIVFQVVYQEKREETEQLVLYTKKGYRRTWIVKLAAVGLATVLLYLLFKGVQWLIVWGNIGIPTLSLPVQSVKGYLYCPYEMSVGDLLFYASIWKLAAILLAANLFFLIISAIPDQVISGVVDLFVLAVQFLLWKNIHYGMWYGGWKEANLFALFSPGHYYQQAVCIRFFWMPVEIRWVGAGFAIILLAVTVWGSWMAWKWPEQRDIRKTSRLAWLLRRQQWKKKETKRNYKLVYFERKKLWNWSRAGVLLIVMALAQLLVCQTGGYKSEEELYYEYYCRRVAHQTGREIEETLEQEERWFAQQQMESEKVAQQYADGELSEESYRFLSGYYKVPDTRVFAFDQLRQQYQTIKERNMSGAVRLFYETGWEKMLGEAGKKSIRADFMIFLIGAALVLGQFGTLEYQFQMSPLIRSKKKGKREYRRAKMRCCIEWSMISVIVLALVRFAVIQSQYSVLNTDIMYAQMGCLTFADAVFWNLPIGAALTVLFLLEVAAGLFVMLIVLLIAEKTKNPIVACFISVAAMGACILILLM